MQKKVVAVLCFLRSSRSYFLLLLMAGLVLLSSCATRQGNYKFAVLLYDNPVYVPQWKYDTARASYPEGAALNIITAMQQGDMNGWLASWDAADRPAFSAAQQSTLLTQWESLKNERVYLIGRIVAENDVIVEMSARGSAQQTFKFPLRKENEKWLLTRMDYNSDYMNWENSTNKIIEQMQAAMLQRCMVNDTNLQSIARQ